MEDLCIEEGLRVFFHIVDQGMDKILRLAATGADKYSVPAIDPAEDPFLRDKLLGILLLHFMKDFLILFRLHAPLPSPLFPPRGFCSSASRGMPSGLNRDGPGLSPESLQTPFIS